MAVPSTKLVVFRDYRSRWDGTTTKILAHEGGKPQRSVGPGEIAVFEATGETCEVEVVHEQRNGPVTKIEKALEYARTGTRFV